MKVIQEVDAQADEIRRLKRALARVTSGRDILKKGLPEDATGLNRPGFTGGRFLHRLGDHIE